MFNHKMLTNGGVNSSRFVGVAETSKPYKFSLLLSKFGFPYLVEEGDPSSSVGTVVRGELYVVNEDKLAELESKNIEENRFEQELIYYLEKQDITEEQVRLSAHLN